MILPPSLVVLSKAVDILITPPINARDCNNVDYTKSILNRLDYT